MLCWELTTNPLHTGKVFVDGKVVYKAGTPIPDKAVVEIKAEIPKYVCRWLSRQYLLLLRYVKYMEADEL